MIPRGIEVLVKKAAVDGEFRALLMEKRSAAAAEIGLELTAAERMMIDGIPASQLESVIARTTVRPDMRAAFMSKSAAVMLAALGAALVVAMSMPTLGHTVSAGVRPQREPEPASRPATTQSAPTSAAPVTRPGWAEDAARLEKDVEQLHQAREEVDRVKSISVSLGVRPNRPATTRDTSGKPDR